MNYLVLFVCSMIIPIVNTSSVSQALISYEIDFIYYMVCKRQIEPILK